VIDLRRRDGRLLRVGHRGAAALAPENTTRSLALAVELGCDLVEFDVVELDGGLVLAHSPAELPEEPASLDEALAFLAPTGCGIHVDLKTPGTEPAIAGALRRHGVVERSPAGRVVSAKATLISGFVRDGFFYTRSAAARAARQWGSSARLR